jgi:hypothetical protein
VRTLLIGTLAATVVGCSCLIPPQASMDACTNANGWGCFNAVATSQPIESTPAASRDKPQTARAKPRIAAKTEEPPPAHVRGRSDLVAKDAKSTRIEAKVEAPPSARPAETSDAVIARAKTTIAAKLEDPASAEFGEMKRAIRLNMLGQAVDTICGRVKGKNASGETTGERPFLYLVKDDDAYVVDGPPGSAAATAYRNICN